MPTIWLISAAPGDTVPGLELADPDCPETPGLFDRPEVATWLDSIGYGPDAPDELVYLATEDDGEIPDGFEYLRTRRLPKEGRGAGVQCCWISGIAASTRPARPVSPASAGSGHRPASRRLSRCS